MSLAVTAKGALLARKGKDSAPKQRTPERTLVSLATCKSHLASVLPRLDSNEATIHIAGTHHLGEVVPLDIVSQTIGADRVSPAVNRADCSK